MERVDGQAALREDVIVPFPDSLRLAPTSTEVRGTLILASIQALDRRGRLGDYRKLISQSAYELLTTTIAATWLPMSLAMEHYTACDRLGFTAEQQLEIGAEVITKIQGTFIGTVLTTARTAGAVSPWTFIPKMATIHARLFNGGGARVIKLGPKDIRAEIVGVPLATIPYYRTCYRGFLRAGALMMAKNAFCTDLRNAHPEICLSYRVAWA